MSSSITLGAGETYTVPCTGAVSVTGSITDCLYRQYRDVRQIISFGEGCKIVADAYTVIEPPSCPNKMSGQNTELMLTIFAVIGFALMGAIAIYLSYKRLVDPRPSIIIQSEEPPSADSSV